MNELAPDATWPVAVSQIAQKAGTPLPQATQRGMGLVEWRNDSGNRHISFRPLFKAHVNRETAQSRWMLWQSENNSAHPVLVLRMPLQPSAEIASQLVALMDGWLVQEWNHQLAKQQAEGYSKVEVPPTPALPVINNFEVCEQGGFQITVETNGWFIQSGDKRLTTWRSKGEDDHRGDSLNLDQLDRLCRWLAQNWDAVAYGKHHRPAVLRDRSSVSACRAYENAFSESEPEVRGELEEWWKRHAFRAADPELPNIFLERQADEVVFSWDAAPSETKSFLIFPGMVSTDARFAIPALREFVVSRFANLDIEPKFKKRMTELDSQEGFRAARSPFGNVADDWLIARRFSNEDARDLAITGTTRHPVVGLLRSAQGSTLSLDNFVVVLDKLRPNTGSQFQKLRALAQGMDSRIDLREPWVSGYYLARQVRAELGQPETGYLDIETSVKKLGIEVCDVTLSDPSILAVCVGSPQYGPLVAINVACQDAEGQSGRRITLAHELCHLLFDRARMRGFARFEGGAADSDRLIEMRANAFAVELLAPAQSFKKPDGTWMSDQEAESLSVSLEVSKVAISRHLKNQNRAMYESI